MPIHYRINGMVYRFSESITLLFWFFFIFFIYTDIPIFFGSLIIPGFISVGLSILILFHIYKFFESRDFKLFMQIVVIVLSSMFCGGSYFLGVYALLPKLIQLFVAFFTGLVTFKAIELTSKKIIVKVFWALFAFILIGTLLEKYGIIRPITTLYADLLFSGSGYSPATNKQIRDLSLVGFSRPLFFTSEPSLVAIGFYIVSISLFFLTTKLSYKIFIFFSTLLFLSIIGSPIVLINLFFLIICLLNNSSIKFKLILLFSTFFLFYSLVSSSIVSRINSEIQNSNTSIYVRVVYPYFEILPYSLINKPFLGFGFGGRDVFLQSRYGQGVTTEHVSLDFTEGANAFVRLILYLGLFGTIAVFWAFINFCNIGGRANIFLFVICWFLLAQTLGTFETVRFWGYTFILLSVITRKKES